MISNDILFFFYILRSTIKKFRCQHPHLDHHWSESKALSLYNFFFSNANSISSLFSFCFIQEKKKRRRWIESMILGSIGRKEKKKMW